MSSANRYRGRTPGEAMRKAKTELGDDARLVSARRVSAPNDPPVYEVRVTAHVPSTAAPTAGGDLGELRREIEALRRTIGDLAPREPAPAASLAPAAPAAPTASAATTASSAPAPAPVPASPVSAPETDDALEDPAFRRWLDLLRRRGVGDDTATRLARSAFDLVQRHDAAGPFDALNRSLAGAFPTAVDDEPLGERSTILVGPTGAGKTTCLAKIAADLAARGASPVLVSADGESLAGEDNLRAVGTALHLPVETAFFDGQLEEVAERHAAGTVFLVDTPGRAPFDREGVDALRGIARALPGAEVVLVLPASTDAEEARLTVAGYESLGVSRIILTKLDETARPGRIIDLARAVSRPIASVTYGRGVRGASSAPNDPRIVSRILGTELTLDESA